MRQYNLGDGTNNYSTSFVYKKSSSLKTSIIACSIIIGVLICVVIGCSFIVKLPNFKYSGTYVYFGPQRQGDVKLVLNSDETFVLSALKTSESRQGVWSVDNGILRLKFSNTTIKDGTGMFQNDDIVLDGALFKKQ